MHRYTILPTDQNFSSAEIVARDGGAALNIVGQLKCGEADVLEDGRYAFSLRLGTTGFWTLFQRDDEVDAKERKSYG